MFERFTERARQVIVLAQEEVRNRNDIHIGCEHILLGLLREEEGLAARILASLDVTPDKVHKGITARVMRGDFADDETPKNPKFTPRAQKALELALREALSLGHNYIGTEHVLLGLLRESDNLALVILREDFSLTDEQVRNEVIRMLSGPKAPILKRDAESTPAKTKEPYSPPPVETVGDALGRLEESLNSTNVLSAQYKSHILAWAYKAVELADKAGREKGKV